MSRLRTGNKLCVIVQNTIVVITAFKLITMEYMQTDLVVQRTALQV